MMIAPSVLR
jgi:hypothetical protein